jgi:putative intracellular protease/amidase
MNINIFLFDGFETLDAFGPVEILGRMEEYRLCYYSIYGGTVISAQNTSISTESIQTAAKEGILVIPGGRGTRALVNDSIFIDTLKNAAEQASYCLSICTGSALLAKTGLLNGRRATSNKKAFSWVTSLNSSVGWVKKARWVTDGKYYTSSGVSAGIDMTLGFIRDRFGEAAAVKIADDIEYIWNNDCSRDSFAI